MAGKADIVDEIAANGGWLTKKQAAKAFEVVSRRDHQVAQEGRPRAGPRLRQLRGVEARARTGPQPRDRRHDPHRGEQERALQGGQGAEGHPQQAPLRGSVALPRRQWPVEIKTLRLCASCRVLCFRGRHLRRGSPRVRAGRAAPAAPAATPQQNSAQINQLIAIVRAMPRSTKRRAEVVTGGRSTATRPCRRSRRIEVEVLEDRPLAKAAEARERPRG